jgi:ribosomal protein L21E
VNKFWGNNENYRKSVVDIQRKKRRNGLTGQIVGTRKEVHNVGILNEENIFCILIWRKMILFFCKHFVSHIAVS